MTDDPLKPNEWHCNRLQELGLNEFTLWSHRRVGGDCPYTMFDVMVDGDGGFSRSIACGAVTWDAVEEKVKAHLAKRRAASELALKRLDEELRLL